MYSAIKVNGKKLYEYARKGQIVEVQPRNIEIYDIELNKFNKLSNEIQFKVECSKGTYIRTLCEDIAIKLGTIGCMKDLDRIKVGRFSKIDAIKIDKLKEIKDDNESIKKYFISFEDILKDKKSIKLNHIEIELFLNGVKIKKDLPDDVYKILNEKGIFLGTGIINNKNLKRDIIL